MSCSFSALLLSVSAMFPPRMQLRWSNRNFIFGLDFIAFLPNWIVSSGGHFRFFNTSLILCLLHY